MRRARLAESAVLYGFGGGEEAEPQFTRQRLFDPNSTTFPRMKESSKETASFPTVH